MALDIFKGQNTEDFIRAYQAPMSTTNCG